MILPESEINQRAVFAGALLGKEKFSNSFLPLISKMKMKGLCGLVYYRFRDDLPEKELDYCRKAYMHGAAADMHQMAKYDEMAKMFAANGIKYCPLKGLALAKEVYPSGALRRRKDMDILLESRETCQQAIALMQENGWNALFDNSNDRHCAEMIKDHIGCELHWLLPGKEDPDFVKKLWQNDFYTKENQYEYFIPAELHFAMLISHEVIYHDLLNAAFRTLIDLGMLAAQDGFDREKALDYCRKFGISNAGCIFDAFPEIFGGSGTVEKYAVLRERFLGESMTVDQFAVAEERFMSWGWIVEHIKGFDLSWLRLKYNRGEKAGVIRMTGFFIKDLFCKIGKLFTFWCHRKILSTDKARIDFTKKTLGIGE